MQEKASDELCIVSAICSYQFLNDLDNYFTGFAAEQYVDLMIPNIVYIIITVYYNIIYII